MSRWCLAVPRPARALVAVALAAALAVGGAAPTAYGASGGSGSAGVSGVSGGLRSAGVSGVSGGSGSAGVSGVSGGSGGGGSWWRPRPVAGQTWQWQLSGTLDLSVPAAIYDVDAVETTAAQVAALHAKGRKVICYINAGGYENWRPDRTRFPAAVLGRPLDGWAGERWLDIRRWDVLGPIMKDRLRVCRAKGFDGVEPDNVDGYANRTGFALRAADQLTYNRRIAALAHSMGLAVGLKNDVEQAATLAPAFDFAVNEECFAYSECSALRAFIRARKPVFHVEYERAVRAFCPATRGMGFTSMRKRWDLDAWRQVC